MESDLISRQSAIDAMTNTLWHYPNECYRNLNEYEFAKGLAELGLKSVPSAQPEQQWIPCSERLPEYWKRVLVCFKVGRKCPHDQIQVGYFGTHEVEDEWFKKIGNVTVLYTDKYYCPLDNVTAWMPLPDPYSERRTDE